MRNLSSVFKEQLNNDNRRYLEWLDITLKDGTVLNLQEDSVWNYGIKFEDSVSDESEFKIGSAIVNKATVTINNIYDDFGKYDFEGAEITVYIGLRVSPSGMASAIDVPWKDIDGNSILDTEGNKIYIKYDDAIIERIRLCTMTVVEAPYQNSSLITLTCQDNMMKFDRDYSESKLEYPASRSEIVRDACNVCGVPLQTVRFDNDDYVIKNKPDTEQLTFRQVLSWVAQIGGQWCKCDSYGRLCIGWYDLKSYENDVLPYDKYVPINSYDTLTVNNEDVVITGIRVTEYKNDTTSENEMVSYQYGKDGYVIEIKDNKLISSGKGNEIATMIGERIVGMRFRPFTASVTNNPAIEAGDICLVTDRKGNTYKSFITTSTFQVGNKQYVGCGAKSVVRNSAKQYSLYSQAMVENRRNLQKERTNRELALEELSKRLSNASGLYSTIEENNGGGNVYYLHNKFNLEESDIVWKMTAEAWGVSTDGGQTWNGGMTVDGDIITRILDAVGVRANWINTGEFKVADEKGNEVFYVNCDTGVVRIKAQQFSLTGESVEEIANKEIDKFVRNIYEIDLKEIKKKLSNKIETWRQDTDPSTAWTTEELKAQHKGDLWYKTSEQKSYIYNGTGWTELKSNPPDEVFDAIDGKAQIFSVQPKPPYNVGDLYFTGNEILVCKKDRDTGEYVASDWKKKDNYTDDTTVNDFIQNIYNPTVEDIQNQIDGKIDTYYFDYAPNNSNYPASEWTTASERQKHVGDLFFWKSKGFTYRYMKVNTSFQWVRVKDADIESAMQKASTAQDTADGKRRVFTSTPQPPYDVGDLWTQGSTGDLMRCRTARATGNYTSSDWILATKYTDDTVANQAIAKIEVLDGKIKLKVTSGDVASIIEEKADYIRLKSSKISWDSTYSSMTSNGTLTCQRANIKGTITSESGNKKAMMTSGYSRYYYSNSEIGQVGTNELAGDSSKKGLVFDLETAGSYMTWASKDASSDNTYSMKMTYVRNSFSGFTANAINMGCALDMRGYTLKNPSFEGGGVTGTSKTYKIPTAINSDGTVQTWSSGVWWQVKNGIIINGAF